MAPPPPPPPPARDAPAGPSVTARSARVLRTYLRVAVLAELQYRINFLLSLVQSLIAIGTSLAVLALVYSHTDSLAGWSSDQLLVLMGVYLMLGGVIRAVIQPGMTQLMSDVETGNLDQLLTRPADAQLLVSLRRFQIWQGVDVLLGLVLVIVGLFRIGDPVGVGAIAAFVLTLLLGMIDVYCFWLVMASSAFVLTRVDTIVELFEGMFQAGRWPVTVYPGWLRITFTFLVPLGFAVTVPASMINGRYSTTLVLGSLAFTIVLAALARGIWRRSLQHYTGASS